jgi:hypothetical protein
VSSRNTQSRPRHCTDCHNKAPSGNSSTAYCRRPSSSTKALHIPLSRYEEKRRRKEKKKKNTPNGEGREAGLCLAHLISLTADPKTENFFLRTWQRCGFSTFGLKKQKEFRIFFGLTCERNLNHIQSSTDPIIYDAFILPSVHWVSCFENAPITEKKTPPQTSA